MNPQDPFKVSWPVHEPQQSPQKVKFSLETIPKDVATRAHECLNALASDSATDEEVNWLIDHVEPKTIKQLSRLNEYLSESAVLEKIIQRKSLPPNFFN